MAVEVSLEDAEWMVGRAGLSGVASVHSLLGGWDNSNLRLELTDGTNLVLKIWEAQKSLEDVRNVIQRHVWLDGHGVPTATPVVLEDGSRMVVRDGVAWTLMPYVAGGHLGSDRASLESLGATMARLHEVPETDCFPESYRMGFDLFEEVISLSSRMGVSDPFVEMLTSQIAGIRRDFPSNLPMGILHGDLFPDNVIGSGGQVSAILDLEEAWTGPMAFDLAMACVGFGWNGTVPVMERWTALFDGYQSIRRLTQDEVDSLPFLHYFATMSIAAWRFWKHNLSEPDEFLSNRYVEMVDRLSVEVDFSEVIG